MKYLGCFILLLSLWSASGFSAEAERDTTFRAKPEIVIQQSGLYYIKILGVSIGGATEFTLLSPAWKKIYDPDKLRDYEERKAKHEPRMFLQVYLFQGFRQYDYQELNEAGEKLISPQPLGIFERGQLISFNLRTQVVGGSADTNFPQSPELCQYEPYANLQEIGYYFVCDDGTFVDGDMDLEFKIYTEPPRS